MFSVTGGAENNPRVKLHMEKGDTVFFHPLIIHGSGTNTSNNFRKAISCHFCSSDSYFIDVRGTTQESLAREIEEAAARKGFRLEFDEIWKLRSRDVKGIKVQL